MKLRTGCFVLTLLAAIPASAADKISKETFGHGGTTRSYYLYAPESVTSASPAPLVVLLHGSGRNGLSLVEHWKDLARKQGIILAGPDSTDSAGWNMGPDGPDFISGLVDIVSAQHPVDPRRVYVFGHSAGAIHALILGLLDFPLQQVRATRDGLTAQNLDVKLTEIMGHTHNYYGRAHDINRQAWDFLKAHTLDADPVFIKYEVRR